MFSDLYITLLSVLESYVSCRCFFCVGVFPGLEPAEAVRSLPPPAATVGSPAAKQRPSALLPPPAALSAPPPQHWRLRRRGRRLVAPGSPRPRRWRRPPRSAGPAAPQRPPLRCCTCWRGGGGGRPTAAPALPGPLRAAVHWDNAVYWRKRQGRPVSALPLLQDGRPPPAPASVATAATPGPASSADGWQLQRVAIVQPVSRDDWTAHSCVKFEPSDFVVKIGSLGLCLAIDFPVFRAVRTWELTKVVYILWYRIVDCLIIIDIDFYWLKLLIFSNSNYNYFILINQSIQSESCANL